MKRARHTFLAAVVVATVALAAVDAATATPTGVSTATISSSDPLPVICDPAAPASGWRSWEHEASISRDPARPSTLIAAWTQDYADGIVTATSGDLGKTWRTSVPPTNACTGGAAFPSAHNAWVSTGVDGVTYLVSALSDGPSSAPNNKSSAIALNRSTNGGATWSSPVLLDVAGAADETYDDKPMILADSRVPRRAVAVWDRYDPITGQRVPYVATTTDGTHWSAPRSLFGAAGFHPAGMLAVGHVLVELADGHLIDVFTMTPSAQTPTTTIGPSSILALTSPDGGNTWTGPTTIAMVADETRMVLAGAAACGRVNVCVAWQQGTASGGSRVAFSRSDDEGHTWSTPSLLSASANPPMLGANGLVAAPSVVAENGTVAVAFYDHGSDVATTPGSKPHKTDVWLARSTDGVAWSTVHVAGPFDQQAAPGIHGEVDPDSTQPPVDGYLGSYQGAVAVRGGVMLGLTRTNGAADTGPKPDPTDIIATFVPVG